MLVCRMFLQLFLVYPKDAVLFIIERYLLCKPPCGLSTHVLFSFTHWLSAGTRQFLVLL
eukprot:m.257203 g.257203  ORF g.257203 m.257203 type:complete len:59 (-) comp23979_c0_seq1:24-200(-)